VTDSRRTAFDLFESHLHLDARGDALRIDDTQGFWAALSSGDMKRPDAARVANEPGYLVGGFRLTEDPKHWEVHPNGDEIIHLMSGAVDFVLREAYGERRIALRGRAACIVPRGVWHRIVVHEPSDVVFTTFGIGTEHEPVR
jgi:oxalate decarboxylase/phosphoglucose isomerase-like protein (cupin superfamily)